MSDEHGLARLIIPSAFSHFPTKNKREREREKTSRKKVSDRNPVKVFRRKDSLMNGLTKSRGGFERT